MTRNRGPKAVFNLSSPSSVNTAQIYYSSLNFASATRTIPDVTERHKEGTNIGNGKERTGKKGGEKYKRKERKFQ